MSDVGLIAALLAAFLLAIGLVRVLGRLIDSDPADDGWADEPPDTGGTESESRARWPVPGSTPGHGQPSTPPA